MPCPDCNHILAYHNEKEILYCPECLYLPVADASNVKQRAEEIQNQFLNHDELLLLLNEYGVFRVIGTLAFELNNGAAGMMAENRMSFKKFFHSLPIIKSVYENADQFNHHFDPGNPEVQKEVNKNTEAFLDKATDLMAVLQQVQEDFTVPIELTPEHGSWTDFFGNYDFPQSEYWLCSERCKNANIGAREDLREDFLLKEMIFRSFDRPDKDEIDTVRDWADFWYGLLVNIGFASALDETVDEAFTTDFPDSVTIFDLENFLNRMDDLVKPTLETVESNDARAIAVNKSEFEDLGKEVFGDEWTDVRSSIVLSTDSTDAHPLFFEISGTKSITLPGGRRPRTVPHEKILYPDQFALLAKIQLFPFLQNDDLEKSTSALESLTEQRGEEFERHVYEFLTETASNAYHSCKTAKQNGNEIDAIFTKDETVYFVESKFMLPQLNMQSQTGIQDVDAAFDKKIFKEGTDKGGKPFPEKVAAWRELNSDAEISHQITPDEKDREWIPVHEEWTSGEFEMIVVSNFVPSYLEKQGVRFLTDLEVYKWLENSEDVFYDILH